MSSNGHDPNTAKMVDLLGQIAGDMKGVQTGLNMLREEVTVLRGDVAALHEDVAALKTDVAEIRADVTGIRNELSGIRVEIRADLADHEERLRRLERGAA